MLIYDGPHWGAEVLSVSQLSEIITADEPTMQYPLEGIWRYLGDMPYLGMWIYGI